MWEQEEEREPAGIWSRYTPKMLVGQGVYGKVHRAKCNVSDRIVAIKESASDSDGIIPNTMREIAILTQCNHPNIVKMLDIDQCMINHQVFFVMEYCEMDLHRRIEELHDGSLNHLERMNEIKDYLYQILDALNYIHNQGIIHRDIKPRILELVNFLENILVKLCQNDVVCLKLADFGLGRRATTNLCQYTPGTQTMLYRAPEVFLSKMVRYDFSVDIWSTGCIFAEMIRGDTLIRGNRELDIIDNILSVVGFPNEDQIRAFNMEGMTFYPEDLLERKPKLNDMMYESDIDDSGLDLLKQMLRFDPHERIDAQNALDHLYFKGHVPNEYQETEIEDDFLEEQSVMI